MGHDNNIACLDCGIDYALGDGSYSNSIFAETLEAFDASDSGAKDIYRNQAHRLALEMHEGHLMQQWSSDWDGSWHWDGWEGGPIPDVDLVEALAALLQAIDDLSPAQLGVAVVRNHRAIRDHGESPVRRFYRDAYIERVRELKQENLTTAPAP